MTTDDKESLKEFLNGFLSVCGGVAVFLVLSYFLTARTIETQTPPNDKFEIVDRYKDRCDVVRYTPDNSARYSYFLDCSK